MVQEKPLPGVFRFIIWNISWKDVFLQKIKDTAMTALELNAQIYQSLGCLATDEHYLKKAADYLKKLVKMKTKEKNALDEALDDIKNGHVLKYNSLEELIKDI